jgi:hypothetical protein
VIIASVASFSALTSDFENVKVKWYYLWSMERGSGVSWAQNIYCFLVKRITIFLCSCSYHLLFYILEQLNKNYGTYTKTFWSCWRAISFKTFPGHMVTCLYRSYSRIKVSFLAPLTSKHCTHNVVVLLLPVIMVEDVRPFI